MFDRHHRTIFRKLPPFIQMFFQLLLALTLLFFILHLSFYAVFRPTDVPLSLGDLAQSLWLGLRFDLRVAIAMLLPLFFLGWMPWLSPLRSGGARLFWTIVLGAGFAFVALAYIVDFGHYAYLNIRLDFSATRFLEDAAISAEMVWESYPVVWISLAYVASIALFVFLLRRHFRAYAKFHPYALSPSLRIMSGFVTLLLLVIGAYSKFSQYPLRWSDAAFSKHPFAAQLAYNPVHYLFDTWKNGRISYDEDATRKAYPVMAAYLQVDTPDAKTLDYTRRVTHTPASEQPNVVLILVESFANYKTSMSGNPLDPTPFCNQLSKEGYYFPNYFTPSTGTARSVFTMITAMPDVELKGTSSRNPLIVDQHTLMNSYEGYEKFYFIGGSASWGNIRGILSKNIDGLHLYEEGDFNAPRNDVWGISDIDLFREANEVFKKQDKPFFAIIQTSGDHRPYTIPEQSYGFEMKTPELDVTRYGFENPHEYNAYRLMDHSIEHFITLAKEAGYAKNTIFAFWGDHGIKGYAGEHVYKGESASELNLGSHRVPFVIWSEGNLTKPQVITKTASEVDVMPTIAGLASHSYTIQTMGRDLFDPEYDEDACAFTILHNEKPHIGMVCGDYYFMMDYGLNDGSLHRIDSPTPMEDLSAQFPQMSAKMRTLTESYYKTGEYMLYHNKRPHSAGAAGK